MLVLEAVMVLLEDVVSPLLLAWEVLLPTAKMGGFGGLELLCLTPLEVADDVFFPLDER